MENDTGERLNRTRQGEGRKDGISSVGPCFCSESSPAFLTGCRREARLATLWPGEKCRCRQNILPAWPKGPCQARAGWATEAYLTATSGSPAKRNAALADANDAAADSSLETRARVRSQKFGG